MSWSLLYSVLFRPCLLLTLIKCLKVGHAAKKPRFFSSARRVCYVAAAALSCSHNWCSVSSQLWRRNPPQSPSQPPETPASLLKEPSTAFLLNCATISILGWAPVKPAKKALIDQSVKSLDVWNLCQSGRLLQHPE